MNDMMWTVTLDFYRRIQKVSGCKVSGQAFAHYGGDSVRCPEPISVNSYEFDDALVQLWQFKGHLDYNPNVVCLLVAEDVREAQKRIVEGVARL